MGGRWLLLAPMLTSTLDRFGTPPLLLAIASAYGVGLADTAAAVTAYALLYGLGQPAWGILADSLGRVRTMRLALLGAGLAGLASAAAPSLVALVLLRALSGAFFGAINPTAMVYVGDTTPHSRRQSAVAELMAAASLGTALGPLAGATMLEVWTWRLMFAGPGVVALALAIMLRRLPEVSAARPKTPGVQFARALRRPWVQVVVGLGFCEGAAILGAFTYLAPAAQLGAGGATSAGLALVPYGVSTIIGAMLVKVLAHRFQVPVLLFVGACLAALGYGAASVRPDLVGVLVASAMAGAGFAFLHSSLLTWASEVAPDMRATVVSLFVASVFVGSSITTAALAPWAASGAFAQVFAVPGLVAMTMACLGLVLRRRYGD